MAPSSTMSIVPPSVRSMLATVRGCMPVVSWIGERLPRDGLGRLFMADCTSLIMRGHLLIGVSSSLHSVLSMSMTIRLLRSATPEAQCVYGVHIVCSHPRASVRPLMTALSKCDPPSVFNRSGSG